jgi:hypothetical protein
MSMFRNDKAIDALVKLGFINPNGYLQAVEVDAQSNLKLFCKKSWFGLGGYVLTDDTSGHLVKDVKWLVTAWGAEYAAIEPGKSFAQIKKIAGNEMYDPVVQGKDKYTGLPVDVIKFALVSCHSFVDADNIEHVFYAVRSVIDAKVSTSKDISDMSKVVKLMGVKVSGDKPKTEKPKSDRRDYRRDDRRDYRRDDREYYDRDYRGRGRR